MSWWDNATTTTKAGALTLLSAGAATAAAVAFYKLKWNKNNKQENKEVEKIIFEATPRKWIKVGEVSQLFIYPVKSCKGIEVEEGWTTPLGLSGSPDSSAFRDRVFLLVNSEEKFRTQRQFPKMVLIRPVASANYLSLSAPGMSSVTFSVPLLKPELVRRCKIWDDMVETCLDCGDVVANWFSEYLGEEGLRLYFYYGDKGQRHTLEGYQAKAPYFLTSDKGTYQDETSFMMMTEESLAKLNESLETPVTINSFRPTILIKGVPHPFAEDLWTFVKIGSPIGEDRDDRGTVFKAAIPCMRCKLTTVNPETGEFFPDGEPLRSVYKLKRDLGNDRLNKQCAKAAVLGTHMGLFFGKDENTNEELLSDGKNNVIRVGDHVFAALL